jgi:Uma2 family endonuclease
MTPPPSPRHGALQSEIAYHLRSAQSAGRVITECPLSTSDGVKAADVAWTSADRLSELGEGACFPRAPEILVEVLSPGNSEGEMLEKRALYFDAGAQEVWICDESGRVTFYRPNGVAENSVLFPKFPRRIDLP